MRALAPALILTLLALPLQAKSPETRQSPKGMTYSIRVPDGCAKGKNALASGLANAEALFAGAERGPAMVEALKKATGQDFAKAKDWKKWLAENAKK